MIGCCNESELFLTMIVWLVQKSQDSDQVEIEIEIEDCL